jgi:uncharacterized protein YkwD
MPLSMVPRALPLASACLVLLAAPASSWACAGAGRHPTAASRGRAAAAAACLIDGQRAAHGLAPLHPDRALARAARRHSRRMVAQRSFAHVEPGGAGPAERIAAAGYLRGARSWRIGETIAWGSGPYATPRAIVQGWMTSPPHRATLLDPELRQVGLGVALGSPDGTEGAATYTADLGARGR